MDGERGCSRKLRLKHERLIGRAEALLRDTDRCGVFYNLRTLFIWAYTDIVLVLTPFPLDNIACFFFSLSILGWFDCIGIKAQLKQGGTFGWADQSQHHRTFLYLEVSSENEQ